MVQLTQSFPRDANRVSMASTYDHFIATNVRTYTGAAGLGAQGATTLFTVTGLIFVRLFGYCTVDLASTTGTIEVGVAGNTATLLAQTTATAIDLGEIWRSSTPGNGALLTTNNLLVNAVNIIETIATADITAGVLTMYALWRPVSDDGNLV